MRVCLLTAGLSLLLAIGACGRQSMERDGSVSSLRATPLYGSDARISSAQLSPGLASLHFQLASGTSAFFQVDLPAGYRPGSSSWQGLSSPAQPGTPLAITILLPNERGVEVGIAALPGSEAVNATLQLTLDNLGPGREARLAPLGAGNTLVDLTIADYSGGQVVLGWTEKNAGDLDLNGEVNAADLLPIARNFNQSYSPDDPFKENLPLYWVDGDGNGVINSADLSSIGQHYRSSVSGYVITRNGSALPGQPPGQPSVLPSAASKLPGLPRRYGIVLSGLASDSWEVSAVDGSGEPGIVSPAQQGDAQLVAHLSISGVELLDLSGDGSGELGPARFASRVITPIEIVNGFKLTNPIAISDTSVVYAGLPQQQTLLLYFNYQPAVDLATGQPKGASAVVDNLVNTAIPIQLPAAAGVTQVDASINLRANPSGGYFLDLSTTITTPGSAALTTSTRLDYASGRLNRDSNRDGVFDDELTFDDDDKDCVSNTLLERARDDDEYGEGARQEARMVATIDSVDLANGTLQLSDFTLFEGGLETPVSPLTVRFNEATEYEDGLTPAGLLPGARIELHFYQLSNPAGGLDNVYWAESFGKEGPEDFAFLEASDDREGEIRIKWGRPAGYVTFILKRFSPRQPGGNYEQDWERLFDAGDSPEFEDNVVSPDVSYQYVYYGKTDNAEIFELAADFGTALPPD